MKNKFKVGKSKIQGYGVFCRIPICKGELICKMLGTEICIKELKRRYESGREKSTDPLQVKDARYIDLKKPYVFINHSCNPNAAIIYYNDLIALRNIQVGEEITYDYSATDWPNQRYWRDYPDDWTMECCCGYSKCRKLIKEWPFMSKRWQKNRIMSRLVQDFIIKKYKRCHGA